jgi:hypothetical protein
MNHKLKLLRAAYLRYFSPADERNCRLKFAHFKPWWETLNGRQRERGKGAMAAEVMLQFGRR